MAFVPRDAAYHIRLADCIDRFHYVLSDFEDDLWRNRRHIGDNIRMAGADHEMYPVMAPARQDGLQWIMEAIAAGYTAIFNKLDLCNPAVARLAQEIKRAYPPGAKTFVTAFLTPSSQHCFGYHYDEVDTFMVQVHGSKEWSVAPPVVRCPVEGMEKPPVDQDQRAREYLRVTLAPGDVLYVPRGHIHKGEPGGAGSLHLSAGVHVPTVAQGLADAIVHASLADAALRQPLAPGAAAPDLSNLAGPPVPPPAALYLPGATLPTLLCLGAMATTTVLQRCGQRPLSYQLSRDYTQIEVMGQLFDYGIRRPAPARAILPAGYFAALAFIDAHADFTAAELADAAAIPADSALTLCRRLATIGTLEIKPCASPT
jgi:hypothetical protein